VGYKIDGKATDEVPPQDCGFRKIEPVYTRLAGWRQSTVGITAMDKLPKQAQEYLCFLQKETQAKMAMIFTGPERNQTILTGEFATSLKEIARQGARQ
jgi:adenylosuccinate synthase